MVRATQGRGAAWLVGLALLAASLAASRPAAAGLAPAPLELSVTPSHPTEGQPAILSIHPRGAATGGAGGRADLYVAAFVEWERVIFLNPAGGWSTQPVAYRPGVAAGALQAIHTPWVIPQGIGTAQMALIVVKAGTDPRVRANWLFQPHLTAIAIKASAGDSQARAAATAILAALGLLTAVAVSLIWVYPGRSRLS